MSDRSHFHFGDTRIFAGLEITTEQHIEQVQNLFLSWVEVLYAFAPLMFYILLQRAKLPR